MTLDMTKGPPARLMIRFALPLLAGNLFQQLYNIADTLIVGRYLGREALAAVGSAFAIIVLVNSILIGLSMGAAVLFAQLFGAREYRKLKSAITMAAVFIFGITVILSAGTFFFTDGIISLYRMPPETLNYAGDYLRCIFAGLIFVSLYNFSANILRAQGDSKSPLFFLTAACIINIILDFCFVLGFGMGVFGAALATVIAQAISGISCTIWTVKKLRFPEFKKSDHGFDRGLFSLVSRYALLTAMQQSVMNFGIVLIQGLVNTFGAALMAAFAAGVKIDAFAYMPVQDFGNALATYTAQNTGAGHDDRVRSGLRWAALISGIFSVFVSVLVFIFAESLIGIFLRDSDREVTAMGAQYLRIEGAFYALIGFLFLFYGFYRGLGRAGMSIILTITSLGTRVLLAYSLAPGFGYKAIFWAIPIGWFLADLLGLLVWLKTRRSLRDDFSFSP
ncbi:MATE family efflux transporter [Breznakiella homolactica]|uniref:Multidrug-efflux transporter n=1 Tax=Breznakiella homolactica TaxID=2798577 RepID=A0A7T8BB36_9SPIR|nr:MATE family efflux transporter [Breznakiella homolactica]QQO08823.1 MATE family efflux transporter [Breznakiella homolactica]